MLRIIQNVKESYKVRRMTTEGTEHGQNRSEFYKAIMTENVAFLTKPENRALVSMPLTNVKLIDFPNQGLAILPVHLAATYKKVQSLEVLLDAGANAELRDQRGRNALHLVITHWPNIVPTWPMPHSKLRVTMEAMQQRAEDCLRVLCEHRVDLNARVSSDSRQTALHLAVRYGALPAVAILASYGANVNLADMIGMSPLHMAAGVLNTDITTCLIELGANVNRPVESSGNTPLHLAVWAEASNFADTQSNSLSCITALLEGGANADAVNHEGRTPLHEACAAGRKAVVDILLCYGADVNKLSTRGENCLFLFLEHKLNLNNKQLLGKLLYLTLPPRLTNLQGFLPRCLELPEHARQRSRFINFAQQPRDLQSLCKIKIYQLYGEDDKPTLSELLPPRIVDFIFDYWESPIEIDFNEVDPQARFQFYPNAHPWFDNPQNVSNMQPNAASSRPSSTNIPQHFTAVNIPQRFASLRSEVYNTLQHFAYRGVQYPPRDAANPEQGAGYLPRGVPSPAQNIPRQELNIPQHVLNIPQSVPNTSRDWPTTQHAFQHIPGFIPGMASLFPNMPQRSGLSHRTSYFPTFTDFTDFSNFNND